MSGYIGTKASVVSSGAERKKVFDITTTTTSLTGCSYTPNQVHVFHNGVRLVDGTDYTATDGSTVTLTTAAQNGDEVVVISYATFQTSDTVSASAGGTFSNAVTVNGNFTVDTNTLFVDAATNNVGIGTSSPVGKVAAQTSTVASGSTDFDTKAFTAVSPFSAVSKIATMLAGYDGSIFGSAIGFSYTGTGYAMQFATNNDTTGIPIERARIDASGNLLVGGTTAGNAGTVSINVGNAGATAGGLQMWAGTAQTSFVQFGDESGTAANHYRGYIAYAHGSDSMQFGTASTERMRIDALGSLLLGTTTRVTDGSNTLENITLTPTYSWFATNDAVYIQRPNNTDGNAMRFVRGEFIVGSITVSSSSTSYNTSSDYRLKENVVSLTGAADRLMQIPVCRFNFIVDPDRTVDGFLAHEVQAFVPECVTGEKDQVETVEVTDEDGNVTTETRPVYQGIDQSKLVPLLTAALQEALQKIDALEARIVSLEGGAA